jgi:hypothetical protein
VKFHQLRGYIIKHLDCELQTTWGEVAVDYFTVLLQHFSEGIGENNGNPQSALPIFGRNSNQGPAEYETVALRT